MGTEPVIGALETPAVESARRILIVEDEAHIRKFLRIALEAHGYEVIEARRGEEGLELTMTADPSLVILDLGLPDIDGQAVITRLREWSGTPILVMSVRSDEREIVRALDAGANDYVTKPAGIAELLARIRVLLRGQGPEDRDSGVARCGAMQIDFARRLVTLDGEPVKLTRKEYELLRLLATGAGRVLKHEELLTEIWGPEFARQTHHLRVLVSSLRHKIGDDPGSPEYILTAQGVGYRFLSDP
jgi:two-component system KDP operon response regulator KdpE